MMRLIHVCAIALCFANMINAQVPLVELDLELAKATGTADGKLNVDRVIKVLRGFEDDMISKYLIDRGSRHRGEALQALVGSLEEPRWMKMFQQCPRDRAWWNALATASTKQLDAFVHALVPAEPDFQLSAARLVAELGNEEDIQSLQEAIAKQAARTPGESLERIKNSVQDVLDCRKDVIAEVGEPAWREQNLQFICAQYLDLPPHSESAIVRAIAENARIRFSPEFLKSRFRRPSAISGYEREMCALLLASQMAVGWEKDAVALIRSGQLRPKMVAHCLSRQSLEELLDVFAPGLKPPTSHTLKVAVLSALGQRGEQTSIEKLEALSTREGLSDDDRGRIRSAIQAIQKRL